MASVDERAILGLFREPDEIVAALDGLRDAGFTDDDLEVLSGTPYPDGTFGEPTRPHHLYVWAFSGGAAGFIVGLLVTIATQISYPMITGGKPLLSIPPMMNVIYEGTLLGAIIFATLGTIFESRLPNFTERVYDPRLTEGYLGVLVQLRGRSVRTAAEDVLRAAGAVDLVFSTA